MEQVGRRAGQKPQSLCAPEAHCQPLHLLPVPSPEPAVPQWPLSLVDRPFLHIIIIAISSQWLPMLALMLLLMLWLLL